MAKDWISIGGALVICSAGCGSQPPGDPKQGSQTQNVVTTSYCSPTLGPLTSSEAADAGDAIPCPPPGSSSKGQCVQAGGLPHGMCAPWATSCPPTGEWACVIGN